MQATVLSSCWVGEYQYYRCCIRDDLTCWDRGEDIHRGRCCFDESPVPLPAHPELWQCTGLWEELRQAMILQRSIGDILGLARQVHSDGLCLQGEASLAVLEIYIWLSQGRSFKESMVAKATSIRLISHALPSILSLSFASTQMRSASRGWPLFSLLRSIRELSRYQSRDTRMACYPKTLEARYHLRVAQESVSIYSSASLPPSSVAARHCIALRRASYGCYRPRCERIQLATLALAYARKGQFCVATSKPCRKADNALRLAMPLIAQEMLTSAPNNLHRMLLSPWPVFDLLDDIESAEPVNLCPVNLLSYYRVGSSAPVNVVWPRTFKMKLLPDDTISNNIRASLLPFCASRLYIRWIANLWRGNFHGPLRIVEGGAEAGSCLLWAAAMLDKGKPSLLNLVGIDPMPAAVDAFEESLRLNKWDDGRIQIVQAALDNVSSGDSSDNSDGLILYFPAGRKGEACFQGGCSPECAAGGCSTMVAKKVRLDALLKPADVIHCLKLNTMGYERDAMLGALELFLHGTVCSVLLEELPLRGGSASVQRLASILALLLQFGFRTDVYARDHSDPAVIQRLNLGRSGLSRLAWGARQLPSAAHEKLGFIVAAWRDGNDGACAATSSPFRPEFELIDFGDVLPASMSLSKQKQGKITEIQVERMRAISVAARM